MAIDLREQQVISAAPAPAPAPAPARGPVAPRRSSWFVVPVVAALLSVGVAIGVVVTQPEAPAAGTTVTYPQGAFTAEREGGGYAEPRVAGYADTWVEVREG